MIAKTFTVQTIKFIFLILIGHHFILYSDANPIDVNPRITNGWNATHGQFPWHVSIIGQHESGISQLCSGSLISREWVLTAAHCVRGMLWVDIGIGSTNLSQPLQKFIISQYIIHPNYNNETKNHDIALIPLPEKIKFSETIGAVGLPLEIHDDYYFKDYIGRVSGFGRLSDASPVVSQLLQWVTVRIIGNYDCQRVYGDTVVTRSTLCAVGLYDTTQNTCGGDSGGALVINEKGVMLQVGVIAFAAKDQCTSGYPGGYMRVTSYLDWIEKHTGVTPSQYEHYSYY